MWAGFDRITYPGDDTMQWLWDNTNLWWCGFYLAPAPSQKYTGWMGKWTVLRQMKWGLAPIYVGQQQKGRGSHNPSADQGAIDGAKAFLLALQAGIPWASVLYLDIEGSPPFAPSMIDYYQAWVDAVHSYGFRSGVYCSSLFADQLKAADDRPIIWAARWKRVGGTFQDPYPDPDPALSGATSALIWQHAGEATIQGPHGSLHRYDLDSACFHNPSFPEDMNVFF